MKIVPDNYLTFPLTTGILVSLIIGLAAGIASSKGFEFFVALYQGQCSAEWYGHEALKAADEFRDSIIQDHGKMVTMEREANQCRLELLDERNGKGRR